MRRAVLRFLSAILLAIFGLSALSEALSAEACVVAGKSHVVSTGIAISTSVGDAATDHDTGCADSQCMRPCHVGHCQNHVVPKLIIVLPEPSLQDDYRLNALASHVSPNLEGLRRPPRV